MALSPRAAATAADVKKAVEYVVVEDPTMAPVRLMTEFLKAVQEPDIPTALRLAEDILAVEPDNLMIQDYRATLLELRSVNGPCVVPRVFSSI